MKVTKNANHFFTSYQIKFNFHRIFGSENGFCEYRISNLVRDKNYVETLRGNNPSGINVLT